jgi:hypothetical protein
MNVGRTPLGIFVLTAARRGAAAASTLADAADDHHQSEAAQPELHGAHTSCGLGIEALGAPHVGLQAPASAIAEPTPGEQDEDHDDQQDEQHRGDGDAAEDGGQHQDDDE